MKHAQILRRINFVAIPGLIRRQSGISVTAFGLTGSNPVVHFCGRGATRPTFRRFALAVPRKSGMPHECHAGLQWLIF